MGFYADTIAGSNRQFRLACEQYEQLHEQALSLLGLWHHTRSSKLALESRGTNLALEGFLDSVWNAIQAVFKKLAELLEKIVEGIRGLFGKKSDKPVDKQALQETQKELDDALAKSNTLKAGGIQGLVDALIKSGNHEVKAAMGVSGSEHQILTQKGAYWDLLVKCFREINPKIAKWAAEGSHLIDEIWKLVTEAINATDEHAVMSSLKAAKTLADNIPLNVTGDFKQFTRELRQSKGQADSQGRQQVTYDELHKFFFNAIREGMLRQLDEQATKTANSLWSMKDAILVISNRDLGALRDKHRQTAATNDAWGQPLDNPEAPKPRDVINELMRALGMISMTVAQMRDYWEILGAVDKTIGRRAELFNRMQIALRDAVFVAEKHEKHPEAQEKTKSYAPEYREYK